MAATAYIGQVEPFEPGTDDWQLYTERLEQFFAANEIPDGKKKAVFLTVIGTKAYSLLRNLLAPTKPDERSYSQLVEVMKQHLDPKPLVIAERFRFHRRTQKEGESVAQYLAELRKLSERCAFRDYLDEALRDRLVCGLQSEAIQRRLLAEADLTLKKALEIAQGMEAANKQASELQATSRVDTEHIHRLAVKEDEPLKVPCYRCGRNGHSPDKCYFRLRTCHACGN